MASDYASFTHSSYTELFQIAENVFCVQHIHTKELCVKKIIDSDKAAVYNKLKHLQHANISHILDVVESDDKHFVYQEYLHGETLRSILQRKKTIPQRLVIHYALQLCDALDFLHSLPQSAIHRDIKPDNIMIINGDTVKIFDFDISREYKDGSRYDTLLAGTRGYAPPEQYGFSETDTRSDIFALGIVLHEMLTGEIPSPRVVCKGRTGRIIRKCIQLDRTKRYVNIRNLKKALRANSRKVLLFVVPLTIALVFIFVAFNPFETQYLQSDASQITNAVLRNTAADAFNSNNPPQTSDISNTDELSQTLDTSNTDKLPQATDISNTDELSQTPNTSNTDEPSQTADTSNTEELSQTTDTSNTDEPPQAADVTSTGEPIISEPPQTAIVDYGPAIYNAVWFDHISPPGVYIIFDELPPETMMGSKDEICQRMIDNFIKITVNGSLVRYYNKIDAKTDSFFDNRYAFFFSFDPNDVVAFPTGDLIVDISFKSEYLRSTKSINVTLLRSFLQTGFMSNDENLISFRNLSFAFDLPTGVDFYFAYKADNSKIKSPLIYNDKELGFDLYFCGATDNPNLTSDTLYSSESMVSEGSYILRIQSKSDPSFYRFLVVS